MVSGVFRLAICVVDETCGGDEVSKFRVGDRVRYKYGHDFPRTVVAILPRLATVDIVLQAEWYFCASSDDYVFDAIDHFEVGGKYRQYASTLEFALGWWREFEVFGVSPEGAVAAVKTAGQNSIRVGDAETIITIMPSELKSGHSFIFEKLN